MEFLKLNEEEFQNFSEKHEQASFYQTINWGKLKTKNGWKYHLLGVKENNKIIAASLILEKQTPIKRKMFYAPRGFLIDYNNYDLLIFFTNNIKKYIKKNKGIFLKIDPYISYQERDIKGNIVENGKNNITAFTNLKKLGYKHFGFNLMQETLQPRWIFITETKNKSIEEIMKNMDPKTRQILRKNEKNKIKVREIPYKELETFKKIMQHTGERRDFIDRPLSYYQNMYKQLHKDNILKILIAELDTDELINEYNTELNTLKKEKEDREFKYNKDPSKMNKNKYLQKQKENNNNIQRIEKSKKHIEDLKNTYGNIIVLGGILFLIYGNEVLSLVGGSYKELMEFQSAYTIHFEGLKYAIENNYERYNFYGITGVFETNNPLYGLYSFKKDFGGKVVELIGEFDLITNKPLYIIYCIVFKTYKFIKNKINLLKK